MYFFGKIMFLIWYDFESDKQRNEIFSDIKNDLVLKIENSKKIVQDEIFVSFYFSLFLIIFLDNRTSSSNY
jgi:hypothetical protein